MNGTEIGGAVIYTNNGKGAFTYVEETHPVANQTGVLAVADVNGDGFPDLVITRRQHDRNPSGKTERDLRRSLLHR